MPKINSMHQLRQFLLREAEWCLNLRRRLPPDYEKGYISCLLTLWKVVGLKQPKEKTNERAPR